MPKSESGGAMVTYLVIIVVLLGLAAGLQVFGGSLATRLGLAGDQVSDLSIEAGAESSALGLTPSLEPDAPPFGLAPSLDAAAHPAAATVQSPRLVVAPAGGQPADAYQQAGMLDGLTNLAGQVLRAIFMVPSTAGAAEYASYWCDAPGDCRQVTDAQLAARRAEVEAGGMRVGCHVDACAALTEEEWGRDQYDRDALIRARVGTNQAAGASDSDGKCGTHEAMTSPDCGSHSAARAAVQLASRARCHRDADCSALTERYGFRPRMYRHLLDGSTAAERSFADAVDDATRFVNDRRAARSAGVQIDEAEVATTYLIEGGYLWVDSVADLSGRFLHGGAVGLDSLVSNRLALGPWLHPSVASAAADPERAEPYINEAMDHFETVRDLTFTESLHGVAGVHGWSKALAYGDLRRQGVDPAELSEADRFFWSTVYFNAGPGEGRRLLERHGASSRSGWDNRIALDNALIRTSTYEYLASRD